MNYVKDLESLYGIFGKFNEIIVYPVGKEGNNFLEILRYTGLLNRVCCIAAPEVAGNNTSQTFVHSMPVIPLEMLVHFRATSILIIAAPEAKHETFNELFEKAGFAGTVVLKEETQKQIQGMFKNLSDSGQMLNWKMDQLMYKMEMLRYDITEQAEIIDTHKETFSKYRNCFRGKKIVIVGSGPSLIHYKPMPDAIHIALNFAWIDERIPMDYLFTVDVTANESSQTKMEQGFDKIGKEIFIGKRMLKYPRRNYQESIFSKDKKIRKFYLDEMPKEEPIQQDICYHPLPLFGSVTFAALSFALFTSPKEIYFVGCDTNYSGHFYKDSNKDIEYDPKNLGVWFIKLGYARFKMFARQFYPDTEIISINPVGLKGLFKDIYTDEFLEAQKNL